MAQAQLSVARIAARAKDMPRSQRHFESARAITTKIQGGPATATAVIAEELADLYRQLGRTDDARTWLGHAITDASARPDPALLDALNKALRELDTPAG